MEAKDCTLKRHVALAGQKAPLQRGYIAGPVSLHPTAGEVVIVEWDNGQIQKVTLRSLLTTEEAMAKEVELEAAAQKLEEEFSDVEKKIKEKLAKAGKLISEAAKLAESVGQELPEMGVTGVLESAMDRAGWRTSSWGC
jgi:hypothetical protein